MREARFGQGREWWWRELWLVHGWYKFWDVFELDHGMWWQELHHEGIAHGWMTAITGFAHDFL